MKKIRRKNEKVEWLYVGDKKKLKVNNRKEEKKYDWEEDEVKVIENLKEESWRKGRERRTGSEKVTEGHRVSVVIGKLHASYIYWRILERVWYIYIYLEWFFLFFSWGFLLKSSFNNFYQKQISNYSKLFNYL